MKKEIYLVVYEDLDYYEIKGYFTNKLEADKYCAKYSKEELEVKIIPCCDGIEDLSDVNIKYEYEIEFNESDDGSWTTSNKPYKYEVYISDYLRSNSIYDRSNWINNNNKIGICVNTTTDDKEVVENTARDLLQQLLNSCGNKPTNTAIYNMNNVLHAAENERRKKQDEEELKQKELAELKRLKEKYETG